MELGTFGAVFNAAIEIETHLAQRYDAQSANHTGEVQDAYRALAKGSEKRLKRLERVRRETVTEMILEPIRDLRLSDDLAALADIDSSAPLSPADAHQLELSAGAFYDKAAKKIGLAEAARALHRLGKENLKRAERLQQIPPKHV
jgi:hypothetical protein